MCDQILNLSTNTMPKNTVMFYQNLGHFLCGSFSQACPTIDRGSGCGYGVGDSYAAAGEVFVLKAAWDGGGDSRTRTGMFTQMLHPPFRSTFFKDA